MTRTQTKPRIVVLDDFFPDLRTGFRVAEFTAHLRSGAVDAVLTTAEPFDELVAEFGRLHPAVAARVHRYSREELATADLAHVVFLNNAAYYLDDLEAAGVPFVVTLYPGGGLDLGDAVAEQKLRAVLDSPLLRHVITTQPIVSARVREVLGEDSPTPISEIPGIVTSPDYHVPGAGLRNDYFGSGKGCLDLAFAAFKYTERGADKGFPEFVEFVRLAGAAGLPVRAHVVGGFSLDDLAATAPTELFEFRPPLSTRELRAFYFGMDLIVSPNRPNVLGPGAFDGFPLGTSIEAALSGVAVMAADPLDQNTLFRDGRDILIVDPDPREMLDRLQGVLEEADGLRRIARSGLLTARKHYGPAGQIDRRAAIIGSAAALADEAARA